MDDLAKRVAEQRAAADKLEKLLAQFPDLKVEKDRWGRDRYYSPAANKDAKAYDQHYSCGCCSDAILMIRPYVTTADGDKIYSDPPRFDVGERTYEGYDVPNQYWLQALTAAGISQSIIDEVQCHFERQAEERAENNTEDDM